MLASVTLSVIVLSFFGLTVFLDSQGPSTSSLSQNLSSPLFVPSVSSEHFLLLSPGLAKTQSSMTFFTLNCYLKINTFLAWVFLYIALDWFLFHLNQYELSIKIKVPHFHSQRQYIPHTCQPRKTSLPLLFVYKNMQRRSSYLPHLYSPVRALYKYHKES